MMTTRISKATCHKREKIMIKGAKLKIKEGLLGDDKW